MLVRDLQTTSIVRVQRSASIQEAARLMRDRHVGAVLITEDGRDDNLIGIVTDRDLAIQAAADGRSPMTCTVGEIMTLGVATVSSTCALTEALEIMRSRGIRRLAVTREDGTTCGMLSLDDVLEAVGAQLAGLHGILHSSLDREMARASGCAWLEHAANSR